MSHAYTPILVGVATPVSENSKFHFSIHVCLCITNNEGLSFFCFLSLPLLFTPPLVPDTISGNTICRGSYSNGCTNGQCLYSATWLVKGQHVQFNVTGRVPMGRWLAIGFSDNRLMVMFIIVTNLLINSF